MVLHILTSFFFLISSARCFRFRSRNRCRLGNRSKKRNIVLRMSIIFRMADSLQALAMLKFRTWLLQCIYKVRWDNCFIVACTPTLSSPARQPYPRLNANLILACTPTLSSPARQPYPRLNANLILACTPTLSSPARQPYPRLHANLILA